MAKYTPITLKFNRGGDKMEYTRTEHLKLFTFVWIDKVKAFSFKYYHPSGLYYIEGVIGNPTQKDITWSGPPGYTLDLPSVVEAQIRLLIGNAHSHNGDGTNDPSTFWAQVPEMKNLVWCPQCYSAPGVHSLAAQQAMKGDGWSSYSVCTCAGPLQSVIIQLNDHHKWTREAIADWIDTLEQQPVFYPKFNDSDRKENWLGNTARVVTIQSAAPEDTKDS